MALEIKRKITLTKKLRFSFINSIPNSIKVGITGEFLGRIGMGLISIYAIFYLIEINGSLRYYPLFLMSLLVSTLFGLLGSKYNPSFLLRKLSFLSPFLMLLIPIAINSMIGLLILYFTLGIIVSFFNPLFSTHIINETGPYNSRDVSYSYYKGSTILGQNFAGFIGGFILIFLFFNIVSVISLKFLVSFGFLLIGLQVGLLYFIGTNANTNQKSTLSNVDSKKDNFHQVPNENISDVVSFSRSTPYLMLLVIILSSFGIGQSYSFIALFITEFYKINLSTVSILLAVIGLVTGFTAFSTSYFS